MAARKPLVRISGRTKELPSGDAVAVSDVSGAVPDTRTVNGHALSSDVTVTKSDVGLGNVTNDAQLKIASNLSDLNNVGTARTNLGVAIGSDVQAYSSTLASWAGVTRASGFDTFVATPSVANLAALLTDEPFTSGIGGTGNAFTKFTGPATSEKTFTLPNANATLLYDGGALGTPASGTLTNATGLPIAGLVASTSAAIGVGSIELGHATDTTLTRAASGRVAVEGTELVKDAGSNGILARTAAGAWAARSVAVTSSTGLSVSNGDGVSGNPTLAGVDATTSAKGVSEFATAAELRVGTDTGRSLVVDQVWAAVAGATLALVSTTYTADLSLFGLLAAPSAAMAGNRTLGAPSNVKNGQQFIFRFTAATSTRTLTLNSAYTLWDGVEVGPYSVTTTQTLYVCGFINDNGVAEVTAIGRRLT